MKIRFANVIPLSVIFLFAGCILGPDKEIKFSANRVANEARLYYKDDRAQYGVYRIEPSDAQLS